MNSIVVGSLRSIANKQHITVADAFVDADVVILVDTSASMYATDFGEKSRYTRSCEELAKLQASIPGRIAVFSFSDGIYFNPDGYPDMLGMNTDLTKALEFVKPADVPGMRFIVISDGEPDEGDAALRVARTYKNKIDVIFIGGEGASGQRYLRLLAEASGGSFIKDYGAANLLGSATKLLEESYG
jgi:hypothetical protein